MDLNLVVLAGKLVAPPELRTFDSGSRLARYLVTVRAEQPRRRVDVIPVSLWEPPEELLAAELHPGRRVWVTGTVQRRFWSAPDGRRSRLEVITDQVCLRDESDEVEAEAAGGGAG